MLETSSLPYVTDVATLRTMRLEDAAPYAAGTRDPSVQERAQLPEPEYTAASVASMIEGSVAEGLKRGDLAVLTIADPKTDAFAGSLVLFDVTDDSAEIGFWIAPEQRGKGRTGAALALGVELARRSGLSRLTARSLAENVGAHRVLERAGFRDLGPAHGVSPSGQSVELRRYEIPVPSDADVIFTTERLTLRPHERRDAAALRRFYGDAEVARYLPDEPWTDADAVRQMNQRLPRTSLLTGNHSLGLLIEHEGVVVGEILLWLTDVERRVAEIGWVLDPSAHGKGIATEAAMAVLHLAFERYGLHRVAAQLDPRNEASARLAQRVGMRQEAHLRENWWSKGEWTDTLVFGALRSDPQFKPDLA